MPSLDPTQQTTAHWVPSNPSGRNHQTDAYKSKRPGREHQALSLGKAERVLGKPMAYLARCDPVSLPQPPRVSSGHFAKLPNIGSLFEGRLHIAGLLHGTSGHLPNVHSIRHFAQFFSGPKMNACAGLCHSSGAATTAKISGQRITVSTLSIRRLLLTKAQVSVGVAGYGAEPDGVRLAFHLPQLEAENEPCVSPDMPPSFAVAHGVGPPQQDLSDFGPN